MSTETKAAAGRTLGEIAAASPAAIETFDRLGLDYCCDGDRTLGDAAERAGLNVELVTGRVDRISNGSGATPSIESSLETPALIEHIVCEYHDPHREDLPLLIELARKVETVHQFDADTPHGLSEALKQLQSRLIADMAEEEGNLFPAIRDGDRTAARDIIGRLQARRRHYPESIHTIETIANGFDLPPGACQSWQRLYFGTARFVDELRYHVHLEHNVLFRRVITDQQD